uniref:(northern house mosquito) hypothetical protein n=1 Tax=Culex pipiens TaxID=7175 RepID=A0A8D8FJM5_CULPI
MGLTADGGVFPAGRQGAGSRHGHQSDVRPPQCDNREIAGRLYRLHCAPAVGNLGRPGASGRPGHPGHAGGEPRLLPELNTAVTARARRPRGKDSLPDDVRGGKRFGERRVESRREILKDKLAFTHHSSPLPINNFKKYKEIIKTAPIRTYTSMSANATTEASKLIIYSFVT